jgi:tetratricopeptide (TPR) repeat protein
MSEPASPTCATCGLTFAWDESYVARSTPGLDPPAGLGAWGARTFCPGCGSVVTEWLVGDWQGEESWEWYGRNAPLNAGRPLPRPPIYFWGRPVPLRLVPLHEETTLDVASIEEVTAELAAEKSRVVPEAACAMETEAKRLAGDGDLVGAARKLEEALGLGLPRSTAARALGELGVALALEADDIDGGIRLCSRSTELWPEACWQAHCVIALFLDANGDPTGGQRSYGNARRYAGTRWWEPSFESRLVQRSRGWGGREVPPAAEPEPVAVTGDDVAVTPLPESPEPPGSGEEAEPRTTPDAGDEAVQRSIRVFVSSTFTDMQVERDELVKRVFPRLRALCESRGVAWSDVDLRWGISDQRRGEILEICLREISACRPYFVGLLGERYGWVPDAIGPGLVEEQPWLDERPGSSITDLEMQHGALNDPEKARHAFFYVRDPAYVETIPEGDRHLYRELPTREEVAQLGIEAAQESARRRSDRLASLKGRIRRSGLPVREYSNPRELGTVVLEDLTEVIEREFPPGSEPAPLAREAAAQAAHGRWLRRGYVERPEDLETLDTHAAGDGPPLLVTGEAGVGKSALLAAWIGRLRARLPDELVLVHYVEADSRGGDWRRVARRILAELNARLGLGLDYPTDPTALRARLADALRRVTAQRRFILVLDGLDHLTEEGGPPGTDWLPDLGHPARLRLIVSARPGPVSDELAQRGWPAITVAPLAIEERRAAIEAFLAAHSKVLEPAMVAAISAASATASPLFLRTVLEELRQFGDRERLDERIAWYLEAADLADLLDRVLSRWQQDFERDRPGLSGDATSLLWAARRGLTEAQLRDLLGDASGPLPQADWSPLYLAAGAFLVDRAGLISITHRDLRRAIEGRYLSDEGSAQDAHLRLADYFEARSGELQGDEELPWQLARAEAWDRLAHHLADPAKLAALWRHDETQAQTYWAQVEANSEFRMLAAYRPVLEAPQEHESAVWEVAALLRAAGHVAEALSLYEHLAERGRATGNPAATASALGNAASCRAALGDPDGALTAYREEEGLFRQLGDGTRLMRSLENQAAVLTQRGEYEAAIPIYETIEQWCRERDDPVTLVFALGNHGIALRSRGDFDAAQALHQEQQQLAIRLGNREQLTAAYDGLGTIALERGQPRQALELFEQEERLLRELGNRLALPACLGNQGLAHLALGNRRRALELLEQTERLSLEMGDRRGVGQALGRRGVILLDTGDLDGALRCFEQHEQVSRDLGLQHELGVALGNKAIILRARGDLAGAAALHEEKARICREIGDRRGLAIALGNQGNIREAMGDPAGAMALYREKEGIDRELGNVAGLAHGLYNQAALLLRQNRIDDATRVLDEQEDLARQIGHPERLARSLMLRVEILAKHLNQPGRALPVAEEAYRSAVASGNAPYADDVKRVLDALREITGP